MGVMTASDENPAYGICALFVQCAFLAPPQVKNVKVEILSKNLPLLY